MNAKRLQRRIIELLSSPRSVQELRRLLQIPERTLRYHLAIVRRNGLLRETCSFSDRRIKLLSVSKKRESNSIISNAGSVKDQILGMLSMVEKVG